MPLRNPVALASVLCVLFLTVPQSARAVSPGDPQCGDRIDVGDVLVIDTEDDSPETAEKLKLIQSARMDERVWPFKNQGSRVQTIRGATRWAARSGCNVLVLGAMTESDVRHSAMGTSDGRGGGNVELRKYLSLRVGVHAPSN